ncbi:MAG: sigma-70 family RNA polymerase sigma factor [Planctomycetes bacterium]|nr:sigma-70 family RNA polymerase sigma factor [Planctomycetota bacterium]
MGETAADPDLPLVTQARAGDFAAFEQLVSRYERRIFATAYRIVGRREDAEEVVQDTFASVIEHLPQFREESKFYTWLMHIAVNHALKLLRRNRHGTDRTMNGESSDSYSDLPHPQFIAPWHENPSVIAENHEMQRLLSDALDELDDKYRTVFVLRDVEERSTSEVAELLGISEANVKVRLLRARLQLRERITSALGDKSRQVAADHRHE